MAFTPTFTAAAQNATMATQGYRRIVDIALDSANAYVSGGFSLVGCGIQTVLGVTWMGCNTAGVGYVPVWNTQTGKLMILTSAASAIALPEFAGTFGAGITIRVGVNGF